MVNPPQSNAFVFTEPCYGKEQRRECAKEPAVRLIDKIFAQAVGLRKLTQEWLAENGNAYFHDDISPPAYQAMDVAFEQDAPPFGATTDDVVFNLRGLHFALETTVEKVHKDTHSYVLPKFHSAMKK